MSNDRGLNLTRRGFGSILSGAAAALGLGRSDAVIAAVTPGSLPDADLRDAALRGLALAGKRGDPVGAAAAEAALNRLAKTDPEGALLGRIYQLLDARPAAYWEGGGAPAAAPDLALLHTAIRACQPVAFGYTDLAGNRSLRTVRPLALVHPPQGVKLLTWCEERGDFRQFFVRSAQGLTALNGNFSADRLTLLQGLLAKEASRA